MKKRMTMKLAAMALIIGGLSISTANQSKAGTTIAQCIQQQRRCSDWCHQTETGQSYIACLDGCRDEMYRCLGR